MTIIILKIDMSNKYLNHLVFLGKFHKFRLNTNKIYLLYALGLDGIL